MKQLQLIEDSRKQIPLVNKSVHSIKSEQQFNSKNATKLVDKKNKSVIIPYNMTPFVKLHEPIKTKFILRDELNTSVQQFREPAENVQPEIDLFEQSMIKSPRNEQNEPLDTLKYTIPLEDPKIGQFPQLFIEPPVLIPYLLEFVSWDPNQLKEIAIKQDNYFVIFEEFKKFYKTQAQKMERKFQQGRLVIEFLEDKFGILDQIQEIDFTLSQYLVSEGELFEQEEQKDEQLVKCQGELEQMRKDIYRIRIHCLELLTICDHQEDVVLHSNEFMQNLREFGEQYRHQNDLFSEQILIYTLSDDLGIERVMSYLRDGSNDQCEEVSFFNNMVEYNSNLDQYTMNLRDLVKQFRIIIQQQLHKTNLALQKHNQACIKVEKSIQQIQRLFQEIPIIMTKLGLSLESGRTLLSRIQIPHLNYSQENQKIYDEYQKIYNENIVLIKRVNEIFNSTQITSQSCQNQKQSIKLELSQFQAENDQIQELYLFLQQIPNKENIISNVQLQRIDIWKNTCQVQSEEILDQNKKEIQKLIKQCQDIINNITQFFGQNKIPFQFVKLKQWAIAELTALEIELEIPKRNTNVLKLEPRINEFLKWESSVPHDNGELGLITKQIQTLYDVNYNAQTQLPSLQIEQDVDQEFNQLVGNEYQKLLNLNETYHIWKNMQAAGIVLSIDYIVDVIKNQKITEYESKIDRIRKFFDLTNQNQYTAYITDIDLILQSIVSKDKNQALQLIQKSKAIPKIYKSQLEKVL